MDNKKTNIQKPTDTGRRSFVWKVGAGICAFLASAGPAISKPSMDSDERLKNSVESLAKKVAVLENEKSIQNLHKTYENLLDRGMYNEVLGLLADDAEVIFNGGVFKGRHGAKRLFSSRFRCGMTGIRIEAPPGFQIDSQPGVATIAPDQKSASASYPYSIQVGIPIVSDSVIVKMSRLHGEGVMRWWEGGICKVSYVKDVKNHGWKMNRLEYQVLSAADYKPGKSHAKPISVPLFSKVYPVDPAGPDRLI